MNGDGKPDLVVENEFALENNFVTTPVNGLVGLLLGNGDGTVQSTFRAAILQSQVE